MKGKKNRKLKSRAIIKELKINRRNKRLMIDKILSYNPMLIEGIEIYKDASNNFLLLIFLGGLLVEFPLISLPCCIGAIFFVFRMLQYIKYKSIKDIVSKLAKDLSSKGIYDKEKALDMIEDFKLKYGNDIVEYEELVNMINKYGEFVIKIERVLKGCNGKDNNIYYEKDIFIQNRIAMFGNRENNMTLKETEGNKSKEKNYCLDFNEKISVLYKREDGEIKEVNKAIEFFNGGDSKSYNNQNAVILNNVNKDNKNLTVYLYKKSSIM
ncbi:hypothetical protein [Clostridium sp. C2-6-12]|uniref:hypothetical protein n=1 Tax=Clostridium sp. C2-6-12 TaxID=2698832 RepID=UPI00136D9593|nr:hypothetical protein [Clostridium sp. C2-6-12]